MGDTEAVDNDTLPWEPDRSYFKLTLKGGPGFEDSWVNIGAGTIGEFRRAVARFFGWDDKELDELSAAQISFNAKQEWHAMNAIGRVFEDTRAVGYRRGSKSNASAAYAAAKEQEQAPPPDPKQLLLAELDQQTAVVDLKKVYAKNKAAFEEKDNDGNLTPAAAELFAAYKAKGKALSSK